MSLDVLIPHFNDPDGLANSLESVKTQSWQGNINIIVVDDGSTDSSYELVVGLCDNLRSESDISVQLLRNEVNLGRPRTRNVLLENATADYIAWLDAGDVWYPEKLAVQFEHLYRLKFQGKDIDRIWITCAYDWEQSGKARRLQQNTSGDQVKDLLLGESLRAYLWTLLGTAKAFRIAGRFDDRLSRLQDLDYFLNFVRGGGVISSPPGRLPRCRYFKSDVGRNADDVSRCYGIVISKHRPAMLGYPRALQSRVGYKADRLAERFARENGDKRLARRFFWRAVLWHPTFSGVVLRNRVKQLVSRGA